MKKAKNKALVATGKGLPNPTDIFSEFTIRGIQSWEEIAVLGKNNLDYLVKRLRSAEKSHTSEIQGLVARKLMFEEALVHKGGVSGYFIEKASGYDNPEFKEHEIGVREGNWSGDPEPLTISARNREAETTTFNKCGWCMHAGGGTCRFQYRITTSCSLLQNISKPIDGEKISEYSTETSFGHDTVFNTPCLLQKLNSEHANEAILNIDVEIERLKQKREEVRTGIRKLLELKEDSELKPWLVDWRPCDYVNVGDSLDFHIGNWPKGGKDGRSVDGNFVKCIAVFGYRHHDGCISAVTDFPVHTNTDYENGRGLSAGAAAPGVMLSSEFSYLHSLLNKEDVMKKVESDMAPPKKDKDYEDIMFLRTFFKSIDANTNAYKQNIDVTGLIEDIAVPVYPIPPKDWKPSSYEYTVKTPEDAGRILCMLNHDLFKTKEKIQAWANMQVKYVHPDKHQNSSPEVQEYAKRKTQAIFAARDLLIERL